MKAVWITPSQARAPAARLSLSERSPLSASTPDRASASASSALRASPSTWCPAASNSRTIAEPMNPAAPVTNTRMKTSLGEMGW
jgi:hypothetical protein